MTKEILKAMHPVIQWDMQMDMMPDIRSDWKMAFDPGRIMPAIPTFILMQITLPTKLFTLLLPVQNIINLVAVFFVTAILLCIV